MGEAERDIRAVLDLASTARDVAPLHVSMGPIPLRVHADDARFAHQVERGAAGQSLDSVWPEATVLLCTSATLSEADLPRPLRPNAGDGQITIVRAGPFTAVAGHDTLWIADDDTDTVLRWNASVSALPEWEATRPLRFVLQWCASRRDAALVHAAAVAVGGRAVLLVGPSGAGKSTSSLACLGSGLDVLSDDACVIEIVPDAAGVTVEAVFRMANLHPPSLTLLPHLRDRVVDPRVGAKNMLELDTLAPGHSRAEVAAILTVVQTPGEHTRVVPGSAAASLLHMGPSTVLQMNRAFKAQTWSVVTAAVKAVPHRELRVGSPHDVPRVLEQLLAGDITA